MATIDSASLARLFPSPDGIPEEHRLPAPIHQRQYLVDGEDPDTGTATCKTVLSPVCARTADGELRQVEIGSYPVMGEAESDAALDAAVAAYDNGARRLADDDGGRAHRLHAGLRAPDGGAARSRSCA